MLSNYHSHTDLCNHAKGYIGDYLLEAKSKKLTILGFSDHCPYPKDGLDTWERVRMSIDESHRYIKDIRGVSKKENLEIYAGFECEWDFRYENWYRDFLLGELNADYLIFGPHWVYDTGNFIYAPEINTKKQVFTYFDTIIEGLASGLYAFLAHPDLIMSDGRAWDANLKAGFTAIIEAAIQYNIPLEVNGQGFIKGKVKGEKGMRDPYPYDAFWNLVAEKNIPVLCNSDAHFPENLVDGLHLARDYAKKMGLEIIEKLNFKNKKLL